MQNYGKMVEGTMLQSSRELEGYKPIVYQDVPDFDQSTHYIEQLPAVEHEDHIFIGVELQEMDLSEEETDEEFLS